MSITATSIGPTTTAPLVRILHTLTSSAHADDTTGDNSSNSPLPYTALVPLPTLDDDQPSTCHVITIDHPGTDVYDLIHADTTGDTRRLFDQLADSYLLWRDHIATNNPLPLTEPIPTLGHHDNPLVNAYFARLDAALEPLRARQNTPQPVTLTIARDVREYTSYTLMPDQITTQLAAQIALATSHNPDDEAAAMAAETIAQLGVIGDTTYEPCDDTHTAVLPD